MVITGGPRALQRGGSTWPSSRTFAAGRMPSARSRIFQEVFQEIEDSQAGGGRRGGPRARRALELAMACHFRVAAHDSRFSMPEVNLGINPGQVERSACRGWSGRRLPSTCCSAAGPGTPERRWPSGYRRGLGGRRVAGMCRQPSPIRVAASPDQPVRRESTRRSGQSCRLGESGKAGRCRPPGDYRARQIVEAVRVGLEESFQAGLRREREAFRECMATPAAQNKIYVFCAQPADGQDCRRPRGYPGLHASPHHQGCRVRHGDHGHGDLRRP